MIEQTAAMPVSAIFRKGEEEADPRRHARGGDAVLRRQRQRRNDRFAVEQKEYLPIFPERFGKSPFFQQPQQEFARPPIAWIKSFAHKQLRIGIRSEIFDDVHLWFFRLSAASAIGTVFHFDCNFF